MRVYLNNTAQLAEDSLNTAVALGRFDAMHLGHIAIIQRAVEYARENAIKSLVYIFVNDPLEVISGKKIKAVNSLEKRLEILESLGVDIVVADDFGPELMSVSCDGFVDNCLKDRFGARFAVAGFNYRFGAGGSGDINTLKELCGKRGIQVCVVPEVTVSGSQVSSTIIRRKIADGDVSGAAELLSRYYSISGKVVRGNRLGSRKLGFPTANIVLPDDLVVPKFGVYISRTKVDGNLYPSITNVGGKPTVDESSLCIETYIDAEFGELYGKDIEVEFCEYIRGISKFDGMTALAAQLCRDRDKAREFFSNI